MSFSSKPMRWRGGPEGLDSARERLRHRWGAFVAFGVLVGLFGLAALILVFSATIASVLIIAVFMILAGGAEVVMGFSAQNWGRFFLWIIAGLAYIVVGAFALAQPLVAALFFTFVLGAAILVIGILRIFLATQLGRGARGPLLFAGTVTALVGIVVLIGWPANSFFVLGTLLGVDLLFWGVAAIFFGLRLRQIA